jgi:hypothetical protein
MAWSAYWMRLSAVSPSSGKRAMPTLQEIVRLRPAT